MNFKKIVTVGILAGIISNLWSLLTCRWLFYGFYCIEPTLVFKKAMLHGTFAWLIIMGTGKTLIAILLTYGYVLIRSAIPGKGIKNGMFFGLLIWLIGMLPSRFLTYMSLNISTAITLYWIINDLINYVLLGALLGFLYKERTVK